MSTDPNRERVEALEMTLAVAYYTPLGWDLDDGDDVDPDGLAECLRAMSPVAAVVRDLLAEAWDEGARAVCPDPDRCWCDDMTHSPNRPMSPNPYRQETAR